MWSDFHKKHFNLMFIFFFFKQKTAYEILTCDWSSDVCSSDLIDGLLTRQLLHMVDSRGNTALHFAKDGKVVQLLLGWEINKGDLSCIANKNGRSEERRVGKECRSRWSPYH